MKQHSSLALNQFSHPEVDLEDEGGSSVGGELEVDEEEVIAEEADEASFDVWFDLSDIPLLPPEDDLLSLEPLVLVFEEDKLGDFL